MFESASRIRDDDVTTFVSKGVFLLAYDRGDEEIGQGNADSFRWYPIRVGRAMQERIVDIYDEQTAGFLIAILTGDTSVLSETASIELSEAGLYHVLAVSGMHCGFLLLAVQTIVGKHRRRMMAVCAIPLLLCYACLTGARPSVIRACVMLGFLLLAPLFQRDTDAPTALSAALFFILLKNPFAALSIGLQLSFGAMAGILWLTPKLSRYLWNGRKHNGCISFVIANVSTTMGALVLTVPLTAWYFGTVVLIAPLSNLLCLWVASVVFIGGLLSLVVPLVGTVVSVLIQYLLLMAHCLASVPFHAVYTVNPYLQIWLVFVYLLFGVAYVLRNGNRRKYFLSTVPALVTLVVTVYLGTIRYDSDLEVMVLDVGQGQSVLLSSGDTFGLVDCGSGNGWYSAGEIAADHLLTMGCQTLDYLILTHYDSDHVNGVTALLTRLDVRELLLPRWADDSGIQKVVLDAAEKHDVSVRFIEAKEKLFFGSAELTVFPPLGQSEDNERGLSVLASVGQQDLLITGDMGRATEKTLLETYNLPDVEYLIAGHHGSKNASSEELLKALKPERVCISVGSNSYGHPSEDALKRMAWQGCTVYRTDLHGTIHLLIRRGEQHGVYDEKNK